MFHSLSMLSHIPLGHLGPNPPSLASLISCDVNGFGGTFGNACDDMDEAEFNLKPKDPNDIGEIS